MSNVLNITKKFLNLLKVRYTNQYLADVILSHQDQNSLLAIADALSSYNIENAAIKLEIDKFDELPEPSIVQVRIKGIELFYIIKSITENIIEYYDDKNNLNNLPKNDFIKIWTGISLLAETTEDSQEIDIEKKLAIRRTQTVLFSTVTVLFLTWLAFNFLNSETIDDFLFGIFTVLYTLFKLFGLVVGILLLWLEVDQYNPTLQSFCSGGSKKINCNAVLQSKYAKLFNGNLSLSIIGFSYFFGSFLFLVINKFSYTSISLLSILSFTGLPVIFISIYYQAVVIKQWCKFCIAFQLVLLSEIIVAFLGNFHTMNNIVFEEMPLLFFLLLLPIIVWGYLKPLLEKGEDVNLYKRGLKRMKSNPIILENLLVKSHRITTRTEGLGILLKNEKSNYNIIKVCNPYCNPCAKAHLILEELLNDNKINLQIIFTARVDKNDKAIKPVRHLLAIENQKDDIKTKTALDDWYKADKKDYTVFANKYMLNGELNKQDYRIHAMKEWCDAEKITHTPTIFINGYKLPSEYSIEDLKDVIQ